MDVMVGVDYSDFVQRESCSVANGEDGVIVCRGILFSFQFILRTCDTI